MEISIALSNLLYAFLGMLLMFLGYWMFEKITPKISVEEELGKGNMAVAIIIAALFISLAYVIGRSLN